MFTRSDLYFQYPPNLNILDLATLVSMYRSRGEPRRAQPGEYLGCAKSLKLVKEAKWWFGLYYSQSSWDHMLTKDSKGYPLTPVELNVLGLTGLADDKMSQRTFVENNSGAIPKLVYMVVNDLKVFEFIDESEEGFLQITKDGEKALNGIARRMYEKKFVPEMLLVNQVNNLEPKVTQAKKSENPQINMF